MKSITEEQREKPGWIADEWQVGSATRQNAEAFEGVYALSDRT